MLELLTRGEPEEPLEELAKFLEHTLLLLAVSAIGREARSWGQDGCDRGASPTNAPVSEGRLDIGAGFFRAEVLVVDDLLQFCLPPRGHESSPLVVDLASRRD